MMRKERFSSFSFLSFSLSLVQKERGERDRRKRASSPLFRATKNRKEVKRKEKEKKIEKRKNGRRN